jgi:hypothetical protein
MKPVERSTIARQIIQKKPNTQPERVEPKRETPPRPSARPEDQPKSPVVRQQGAEKGDSIASGPESETFQEKKKRFEGKGITLNPVLQQKVPAQRAVAQPPKAQLPARPPDPPAIPSPGVVSRAHAALDLAVLSKLPMKLSEVKKGNKDKLTCRLKVGDETYIIKAGAGYTTMEDHIANTDVLIRLDIPGVHAPLTKKLTDDFRKALQAKLKAANPSEKQLLDALVDPDAKPGDPPTFAQISKLAPGNTVQDVFDADSAKFKSDLVDLIEGQDREAASKALADELQKYLEQRKTTMEYVNGRNEIPKLKNPAQRDSAIKALNDILNLPKNQEILRVLENVNKQDVATVVQDMKTELSNLSAAKTELQAFAQSEDGGQALGGMAVADLLLGMNDRIVGDKFNGGNFMFDRATHTFWCVDNAKDLALSLSANDPGRWKDYVVTAFSKDLIGERDEGDTLENRLEFLIYDRKTEESRDISQNVQRGPGEVVTTRVGIGRAVAQTLQKMHDLVNDTTPNALPLAERNKLKARIAFIEARQRFLDLLKFDPVFQTVPDATNPGFFTKVVRVVKKKGPDVKQAQDWKEEARAPNTSLEKLKAIDDILSSDLSQPDADDKDQSLTKAWFAARSARLIRSLDAKTAELKALAAAGNKAWGDVSPDVIARSVKAVTDPWSAKLAALKDKDGTNQLDAAVNAFVMELNPRAV